VCNVLRVQFQKGRRGRGNADEVILSDCVSGNLNATRDRPNSRPELRSHGVKFKLRLNRLGRRPLLTQRSPPPSFLPPCRILSGVPATIAFRPSPPYILLLQGSSWLPSRTLLHSPVTGSPNATLSSTRQPSNSAVEDEWRRFCHEHSRRSRYQGHSIALSVLVIPGF